MPRAHPACNGAVAGDLRGAARRKGACGPAEMPSVSRSRPRHHPAVPPFARRGVAVSAVRRFAVRHGAFVASGLVASLPAILSTAHGLAVHSTPVGDDAVIAPRSYDVLTSHSPLVGQYSASSVVLGQPSHSLGPMLYWLLAVPARLGP